MRHGLINADSGDTDLLIPAEFQEGVYLDGAEWLLRHQRTKGVTLEDCPGFMEAMGRMIAARPQHYDEDVTNLYPGTRGILPHDRKVVGFPDGGYMVMNDVSV